MAQAQCPRCGSSKLGAVREPLLQGGIVFCGCGTMLVADVLPNGLPGVRVPTALEATVARADPEVQRFQNAWITDQLDAAGATKPKPSRGSVGDQLLAELHKRR